MDSFIFNLLIAVASTRMRETNKAFDERTSCGVDIKTSRHNSNAT